jgi:hypothetical protein
MDFSEELGQCITALLDYGFEPPLYFTCMAVNGAMVYGRFAFVEGEEELHCDILAAHETENEFAVPVNIIFVDQAGQAARVLFGNDGTSEGIQVFPN